MHKACASFTAELKPVPWDVWVDKYEAARAAFARFMGAKPEEVAVVTSASAGINAVASALGFTERKKVIIGEFEFPTMGQIWLAQRPRGAEIEWVRPTDNRIPPESYERSIDRQTLVVPLTRVSFLNGFRSDVEGVACIAHERGALVFLDYFQDCGTRLVDVKALGVDFYVTGTLKYLLGPSGLAFLYIREELIERLVPTVTGWFAQRNIFAFETKVYDPAPTARRFETGTPPIPAVYAALPAFELLEGIGMANVAAQVEKLIHAFMQGARDLGIEAKTPPDSIGPLVVLRTRDAGAVVARLAERNIVTSARHDGVRVSFHVHNNRQDVEAVLKALGETLDLMVCRRSAA